MALLSKKKKKAKGDAKTKSAALLDTSMSPTPSKAESVDTESTAEPMAAKPLSEIVEESKQALAEQEQVPPVKRGRPPGSKNKAKEQEIVSNESNGEQNSTPDSEAIADGIQFLGAIAADQTGFSGWNFEKDESRRLGVQIDRCLSRYFPQLSEGNAVLVTTIASVSFAIGGRYIGYRTWRRELEESERKAQTDAHREVRNNEPIEVSPSVKDSGPKMSASEFFPRSH